MIFRRSNDPVPAQRKTAPTGKQPFDGRREPSLQARGLPPVTAPNGGPVNPVSVAQARRTPQPQNPATNFSGKDQSRKLTVGRDISLNGEIATCDHLIVEGTVKATIKGGRMLEISESGTYQGVVDIENADIAGRFEGDLIVRGKLIIRPTAQVTGNLYYGRLQVDTGAAINASLNTLQAVTQQDNAPVNEQQRDTPAVHYAPTQHAAPHTEQDGRLFSLASLNDEPGFLRANAN